MIDPVGVGGDVLAPGAETLGEGADVEVVGETDLVSIRTVERFIHVPFEVVAAKMGDDKYKLSPHCRAAMTPAVHACLNASWFRAWWDALLSRTDKPELMMLGGAFVVYAIDVGVFDKISALLNGLGGVVATAKENRDNAPVPVRVSVPTAAAPAPEPSANTVPIPKVQPITRKK